MGRSRLADTAPFAADNQTGIVNVQQDAPSWTDEVRQSFRDPRDLATHLGIPLGALPALPSGTAFPFLCTRPFASRMRPGDPADPLLAQVWPDAREDSRTAGETDDPVGDRNARADAGVLRKYRGRVLLVTTGSCAINCRYCFRQNYDYGAEPRGTVRWDATLRGIEADPGIREAILSGGDPLALTDSVIAGLAGRLSSVPSLRTLRVHTRLPVVLPSRVTDGLLDILRGTALRVVVVLHCNHPAELDREVASAVGRLRDAGATVLNQSVLLRGVNDSADTLEALSLALWDAGILPYYLHALDAVAGSSRFAIPDAEGALLCAALRSRLPGYLVPRFVREIEGEPSKTPLG